MRVKIFTLTTDGDNVPIETEVFGSEAAARASIIAGLESYGIRRCKEGHKLSAASTPELCELWEQTADGACMLEEHVIDVEPLCERKGETDRLKER